MQIGIIGTGAIGGTIAKKLALAGHTVKVSNTEAPGKLAKTARQLGVSPSTIQQITTDVDVVIISVPTIAILQLPKDLFTAIPDKVIVVDTSNYYPFRDGEIQALKNGEVESVWVAEVLGRPVIKAFNNLLAYTLENKSRQKGPDGRIAMAVSGDDAVAKRIVASLANDVGFDAVDIGNLSESWRHQPGTPAYCTELTETELKQALTDAVKENAPHFRDLAIARLTEHGTTPSHDEIVALNRSLFAQNPKIP